jgi:hypothetical protein
LRAFFLSAVIALPMAGAADAPALRHFWENLRQGHDLFSANAQALRAALDKNGDDVFTQ